MNNQRMNPYQRPTPQYKNAQINRNLGNPGLDQNQGTSVEVYDYIKVTTNAAKQTISFFEEVNTKKFPFTNIQQNQLGVGESLAIEYMFFPYMIVDDTSGEVLAWGSALSLIPGLNVAQLSTKLDNARTIKKITLARSNNLFNLHGATAENHVFYPDTDLIIPVQIDFSADLVIPPVTITLEEETSLYLGCHWTGSGSILNLKENV